MLMSLLQEAGTKSFATEHVHCTIKEMASEYVLLYNYWFYNMFGTMFVRGCLSESSGRGLLNFALCVLTD